jgi:hypothetical protein
MKRPPISAVFAPLLTMSAAQVAELPGSIRQSVARPMMNAATQ